MSQWMMHRNEDAFPEPMTFDPTRWIDQPAEIARLREQCLVPFSRGSRICIGMNLALAELYITLGTLFRRFDNLRDPEIRPEDMAYEDYFSSHNPVNARKLSVVGPSKA